MAAVCSRISLFLLAIVRLLNVLDLLGQNVAEHQVFYFYSWWENKEDNWSSVQEYCKLYCYAKYVQSIIPD